MASEAKRGCGYRQVGGLYLVGGYILVPCDRLPYEIKTCPTCGHGIHFTRSMTAINPRDMFGSHPESIMDNPKSEANVKCQCDTKCFMCYPKPDLAYVMMVGEKYYTPSSFTLEAHHLGISKRIPFIPKKLELGKTIFYLAHKKACTVKLDEPKVIEHKKGKLKGEKHYIWTEERLGIFCAFIPRAIEMPCWESQLKGRGSRDFKKNLKKRGITPVPIKDGDKDHNAR